MSIAQIFESGEQSSQKGHFRNLVMLARIDGAMVEEESNLLKKVARRLAITDEQFKEICNNPMSYPMIPPANREERYERFIQLIQMICADGEVDPKEEELVKRFGISLGFTNESLNEKYPIILQQITDGVSREDVLENIM